MRKYILGILLFLLVGVGVGRADDYSASNITVLTYQEYTSGDNENATKLLDGNKSTKWCTWNTGDFNHGGSPQPYANRNPDKIVWKTASSITMISYTLTTGGDTQYYPARNWKSWTICGGNFASDEAAASAMNDSEGWTIIDQVANDATLPNENTTDATFACSNPGTYKYYRLVVDAVHQEYDYYSDVQQMAELTMHYTPVSLPAASVTAAPTAKTGLVANGSAQALVNAGTASGGTMHYSLNNSTWSSSVPTATAAGKYTVYYKVVGDAEHSDYTPASNTVAVTIDFSEAGTAGDPYLIPSTEAWNLLAEKVNGGTSYSGKYFRQTADISVTTMVGASDALPFSGTYDGDGHTLTVTYTTSGVQSGPFRFAQGATIKNLHTTGSLTTSAKGAGGILGHAYENNTLINCRSSVEINSSINGDGTHGGLIGSIDGSYSTSKTVIIEGCVFNGRLVGSNTNCWGGFVGWCSVNSNVYLTVRNSLYAPQGVSVSTSGCQTFSRASSLSGVTVTNSYYTQTLGGAQGKQAYSITPATGITVTNTGSATVYNVSGITSYGTGIKYNGVLYGGNGDAVSLNLSGSSSGHYVATAGSLSGSSNPYTLTMSSANSVVGERTASVTTSSSVTTEYPSLELALAAWEANSTLTLLRAVTTSSTITVNNTSTLDLNGYGIKRTGSGTVIRVAAGKTLTINDSNPTSTHKFSVNSTTLLATLNEASGTLTINGGYITGGYSVYGCAIDISVNNGAHCVMNGGTLIGNTGLGISGNDHSVVCVARDAKTYQNTFTMNGGAICYNNATGVGLIPAGSGSFSNCSIHHNKGVGINMWASWGLTLNNVEITYNQDGGISSDTRETQIHIQGRTIISNNTKGGNPVDINYDQAGTRSRALAIDGPLDSEARVGIYYNTSNITPGVFTSGLDGNGDATNFVSNLSGYGVKINGDGEALLATLASLSAAPTAKTGLVYNGSAQALVNAGTATNGTMYYSLDNSDWSSAIPTAKNAGNYTVYYKVVGDESHADYTPSSNTVAVTIGKEPLNRVVAVADGRYVVFSPGNLQYQASTNTWRFGEHQYSNLRAGGGNLTPADSRATQSEWIDLFGWGTSGWDNTAVDATAVNYQPWACENITTYSTTDNKCHYGPSTTIVPQGENWSDR